MHSKDLKNNGSSNVPVREYVIDASANYTFGRLCTAVARAIQDKDNVHRIHNCPNSIVTVINLSLLDIEKPMTNYYHTGYPGGLRERNIAYYRSRNQIDRRFKIGLRCMLPRNKHYRRALKNRLIIKL